LSPILKVLMRLLEVEKEMWDIWLELVEEELPLPLGGMAP